MPTLRGMADTSFSAFTGIQNTLEPDRLGKRRVADAVNGFFNAAGDFEALPAPAAPLAPGASTAAWRAVYADLGLDEAGQLHRLGLPPVRLGVQLAGDHLAGAALGPVHFVTDGREGYTVGSDGVAPWSIPEALPIVTPGAGALPAGTYRVAVTWVLVDGRESSAEVLAVDLGLDGGAGGQGLVIEHAAAPPPGAVSQRIYLSDPNGQQLYERRSVAASAARVYLIALGEPGAALDTAECRPMPAGRAVALWGARLAVAVGTEVLVSAPYQHHLHQSLLRYRFEHEVRALAGLEGGLLVGTAGGLWLLPGLDAEAAGMRRVHGAPVLLQNPVSVYAGQFPMGESSLPLGVLLVTHQGVVHVSDEGAVTPLTAGVFHLPPTSTRACGAIVEMGGGHQFLFTVEE